MEECAASACWPVAVPAPALRIASYDAPPASEEEELRLDSSSKRPVWRAPTDLLWSKKRYVTNGGPQLTSFDPKNVTSLTGGPN